MAPESASITPHLATHRRPTQRQHLPWRALFPGWVLPSLDADSAKLFGVAICSKLSGFRALSILMLHALPPKVSDLANDWGLSPDGDLRTTRSSWLLPVQKGASALMLKVARIPDEEAGYRLMSWWRGQGAVKVLAEQKGVLLLERATGARSLSELAYTGQDDQACRILCATAELLHAPRTASPPDLHPLEDWFRPLLNMAGTHAVLRNAAVAAGQLLSDPRDPRPLHGDLHHDNVLDFGDRGWLAIDPHGLVGERAFDYANIFTNPDLGHPDKALATLPGRLEIRLRVVAEAADLDPTRLLDWVLAWTGLSAAWSIGDGDDESALIDLKVHEAAARLRG